MAKRYYSANQLKEKRMIGEEYYATFESSKRQQLEDSGMIREDHSQIANLPQEVMIKPYPTNDYAVYGLDDTSTGIDKQMNKDVEGARKHRSSRKY